MLEAKIIGFILFAAFVYEGTTEISDRILVCFYSGLAQNRSGPAVFEPKDVDIHLCSHLVLSHALVKDSQITRFSGSDYELYADVIRRVRQNPALKVLLAIGGREQNWEEFTTMAATNATIDSFMDDAISYVRRFGFDGVVINWLYPTGKKGPATDKERFTLLLERALKAFVEEAEQSDRERLLLAATVSAHPDVIEAAYEVDKIHRSVDFLVLMTKEFHTYKDQKLGHNCPLFPPDGATEEDKKKCQDWAVREWSSKGTPRSKIILGMTTYGAVFKLPKSGPTTPGTPTDLTPDNSRYTKEIGTRAFYEICQMVQTGNWTTVWSPEAMVPYSFGPDPTGHSTLWVSYENELSLKIKAEYIREWGLRGAALWFLDTDDFSGSCKGNHSGVPYPLTRALSLELTPGTLYKEPDFDVPLPGVTWCTREGTYPDPSDCRKFYTCSDSVLSRHVCEDDGRFDVTERMCVSKVNVTGCP